MKIVALLSGGKDSLYNLFLAVKKGHEVVAIANLKPPDDRDELDSYMYQTVGHQAIEYIATALDKPLFRAAITGTAKNKDLEYEVSDNSEDEVEQLHDLLKDIRHKHNIEYDGVSVGAIASSYQSHRVQNICKRLNLEMLAYLWNKDQDLLLQSMIEDNFDAILIKVACIGLNKDHVGQSIASMQDQLRLLNKQYGCNVCGEGGEYETLVLDCPLYKRSLSIESFDVICHSKDAVAPVYYMRPNKILLVDKSLPQ